MFREGHNNKHKNGGPTLAVHPKLHTVCRCRSNITPHLQPVHHTNFCSKYPRADCRLPHARVNKSGRFIAQPPQLEPQAALSSSRSSGGGRSPLHQRVRASPRPLPPLDQMSWFPGGAAGASTTCVHEEGTWKPHRCVCCPHFRPLLVN